MRHWILIIFGRNVSQECFAGSGQLKDAIISHLTWLSALPCKTGNMEITPLHLSVVCCFVNKHTHKYQNYNLVVVRLFFIHKTINNMHQTWPTQGTKHPAMWYAHSRRSPCLPWYRAPLWQSFSADGESHRTLSVRFFTTLFQQILTVIKHVADDNFVFSRTVHGHIMHAMHWNCRRANSQFQFSSVLLIITFSLKAQQWSPLNMRFRDSYISTSISCESTRLKKSSSDWLKSREVEYSIRVKNAIFVFFFLFHKVVQRQHLGEVRK